MEAYVRIIEQLPEGLSHVRQLLNRGKVEEVIKLLFEFEKKEDLTTEEKLVCQLSRASIVGNPYIQKYEDCINIAEEVVQSALELGNYQICVDALLLEGGAIQAQGVFNKKPEELDRCEKFLKLMSGISYDEVASRKASLLALKGWHQYYY